MQRILNELKTLFAELIGFAYSTDTELQGGWSISQFKEIIGVNFSDFDLYVDLRFSSLEEYVDVITPSVRRALNTILYEIVEINWNNDTNVAEFRLLKNQRNDVR